MSVERDQESLREKTVFSIDCESTGLYGETFAVGVSVRKNRKEIDNFYAACPFTASKEYERTPESSKKFLNENVLPHLTYTHETPRDVRDSFWAFYMKYENDTNKVADCGVPVEVRFFRDCVNDDLENRMWKAPYPLHELGTLLLIRGKDPTATYERLPDELPAHNPLCDARQSGRLWESNL